MSINKTNLKELLKKKIVEVKFKKKDNSERLMTCTLRSEMVPIYEKKTNRTKPEKEDTLAVWDLDKQAFRSFNIDSVIEYFVLEEGYEL